VSKHKAFAARLDLYRSVRQFLVYSRFVLIHYELQFILDVTTFI